MKQLHGSKSAAKLFSPAAIALAVGLACWGSVALATVTPIAGIPIGLEGDPGSVRVNTKTDEQGNFKFTGLPAGKYRVKIPGQPDQFFTVGHDGTVRGKIPGTRKAGKQP